MLIVYAYWGCVTADGERKDVRIMMDLLLKGIVLLVFILLAIVVLSIICFIGSCVAENMREEREKSPELSVLYICVGKTSTVWRRAKMKVAVTYENGEVFPHFGRTPQFKVYEIENGLPGYSYATV